MDVATYQDLIRNQSEDCKTIEDLSEFLDAFLSRGTMIDEGPGGRERVTFVRVLVGWVGPFRIVIHPREHAPPHFHVVADGINASFAIETGEHLHGEIPARELRLIQVWYGGTRKKLIEIWNDTRPSDCAVGPIGA